VDGDCCGRNCIRQMIISQRDIQLSEFNFLNRQHHSPNRTFVAISSEWFLGRYVTLIVSYSSGLSFATVYRTLAQLNLIPIFP
jgi:hypothetical protein